MNGKIEQHPFSGLIPTDQLSAFCAKHLGQSPAHFPSAMAAFSGFGINDFLGLLQNTLWADTALHLVPNSENKTSPDLKARMLNVDGRFTPDKIRACILSKSTVVVNGIDRLHPAVRELLRPLNQSGEFTAKINAYFTPANAQGFLPHWDRHDVVVLQVSGQKHWRVSNKADYENPLEEPKYLTPDGFELTDDQTNIVLDPCDVLYVPRGFGHYATAMDSDSLHFTIGINPIITGDVMIAAIQTAIESDPALRTSFSQSSVGTITQVLAGVSEEDISDAYQQILRKRAKEASTNLGQIFGEDLTNVLNQEKT